MEQNVTQPGYYADPVAQRPVAAPMSTTDWLVTMLITFVPLVGFIMLFVWAFGSGTNPNKANWAKANLIFFGLMMVLAFLFAGSMMAFLAKNGSVR